MQISLDTNHFNIISRDVFGVVLEHKQYKYKIFVHTPDDGTDDIHFYKGDTKDFEQFLFSDRYKYCQFASGVVYSGEYGFYWS